MNEEIKNLVLKAIQPRTYKDPITAKEIAFGLNMFDRVDTSQPKIRLTYIIRLLEEGHPIGSGSRGYYMMKTSDDLKSSLQWVQNKIDGHQNRIELLANAYGAAYHGA